MAHGDIRLPDAGTEQHLKSLDMSILRALAYFDVFKYPLTQPEIGRFLPVVEKDPARLDAVLQQLVVSGKVHKIGAYYSLHGDPALVARREKGNAMAASVMPVALRRARLITAFPFVECVCLSGSLSKNYFDRDADVDFFIVTRPGRLWIARTLLIAFKKVFLLNSYKYFCLNYFIDTDHLRIEEQNHFTATELATLMPLSGAEVYRRLMDANPWMHAHLPNALSAAEATLSDPARKGWWKRMGEYLLKGAFGDFLDHRFMRITMRVWEKKFSHFKTEDFQVAMKSRRYVSKHHPQHFQKRVLGRFMARVKKLEQDLAIPLEIP